MTAPLVVILLIAAFCAALIPVLIVLDRHDTQVRDSCAARGGVSVQALCLDPEVLR